MRRRGAGRATTLWLAAILWLGATLCAARGQEALAAGWGLGEHSTLAGGTGGAGSARAADPAAAWYNPAALTGRAGIFASAGILIAAPSVEATALDGSWQSETRSNLKTPPHAYLSYAWGRGAVGVAFNVPFGSGVAWPKTWPGRFESVTSSVKVFRLSPFFGWRFGKVGLAAGVQVDIGLLQIERQLDFVDTEGGVTIDLSGAGVGGHAAIFIQAHRTLAVGLTYKSQTAISLDGVARFAVPNPFVQKASDQAATSAITLPDLITLGLLFQPHEKWQIALDVGLATWAVLQTIAVAFADPNTAGTELTPRWKTRAYARGGASYRPIERIHLRLGLVYDPSPAPAETLAPSAPDSDRFGATFGAGVRITAGLSADVFYAHLRLLGNATRSSEALQADYRGAINLLGVGLRWQPR